MSMTISMSLLNPVHTPRLSPHPRGDDRLRLDQTALCRASNIRQPACRPEHRFAAEMPAESDLDKPA